jgi:hypothetical protein
MPRHGEGGLVKKEWLHAENLGVFLDRRVKVLSLYRYIAANKMLYHFLSLLYQTIGILIHIL